MTLHPARSAALAALLAMLAASGPAAAASPFEGLWCGTGLLREFSLQLNGRGSREVDGRLMRRDRVRDVTGRIEGDRLRTQATRYGSLVLEAAGGELLITGGDGPLALASGASFRRARGSACGG
jgi:hypothetical protein